ncbi:MAG: hypothetical protein ACRDWD_14855, partial [Acidimicrobiia bacterium]
MSKRRLLTLSLPLLAVAAVLLASGPALARGGDSDGDGDNSGGNRVVLNGRVDVVRGDTVENVVIFNGPAVIAGHVKENVIAFNGNIRVSGRVDDNVVVINGQAIILGTAQVGGDVRSSDEPAVARGARVDGNIEETNFASAFDVVGVIFYIVWWIALTISLFALGMLFLWLAPRAADAAVRVAKTRVGPSIGWGLLLFFGIPIASVIILFTLVGAPLGFVGLFAMVPLVALGYVTSAYFVGRLILKESNRFLVFLLGWGILRFAELFPVLGHLV